MTLLLEVDDLRVDYMSFGVRDHAVNGLSFSAGAGEVVGIVGESGSGKTSAILAVLGLTRAGGEIVSGSVRFEGRELLTLDEREWRDVRGGRIALVTQNPRSALNPVVRVGDQIAAVYRAHREAGETEARERARDLLRAVGINDPDRRLRAYPHELSGGMAQRVVIAMALSCSPTLLLADEPTSGLDVTVQAQLLDDLREAAVDVGSSLVLVTQDLGIVANYCDRVYLLHAGEVVEEGPVEAIFGRPAHPVGAALLAAQRGSLDDRLRLSGFPVDGRRLPDGCYLSPRCPFADAGAGCFATHPEPLPVEVGHTSRCFRHELVRETAGDAVAVPSDRSARG